MVFNSIVFFIFFGLVVLARYARGLSWNSKKAVLLVASYFFYAAWNPPFVLLLWISTIVDWGIARRMVRTSGKRRGLLLVASLIVNLGLLSVFKYGQFFVDSFVGLLAQVGVEFVPVDLGLFLPVGISFYTFQTLSWTIDVYRGEVDPTRYQLLDFALFVAFFPQLVAGPIVRASSFMPQLVKDVPATRRQLGWGFVLLTVGLFEKTALADGMLAPVSDVAFANGTSLTFVDAWIGTLAFSGQIFFDFAGYSTCAIGVAMILGFSIPENFRFPYAAAGFSDFWRRWHISLSSWLRDYLYIPLGGNRHGESRRRINLMTTMLLGGLWHGASWTFVFWGFLHGLYLGVERTVRGFVPKGLGRPALFLAVVVTQVGVLFAWIPFRAASFETAWAMTKSCLGLSHHFKSHLTTANIFLVAGVSACLYCGHFVLRNTTLEAAYARVPSALRPVVLGLLIVGIVLAGGGNRAFIYFQF